MCVTNSQRNVCYRSFTNQYKPQSYKNQALLPYSLPYNDEFLENLFNLVIRVLKKKKRLPWAMCKSKTKRSLNCPISPLKSQTGKRKKKNKNLRPFFFEKLLQQFNILLWLNVTTTIFCHYNKVTKNSLLTILKRCHTIMEENQWKMKPHFTCISKIWCPQTCRRTSHILGLI